MYDPKWADLVEDSWLLKANLDFLEFRIVMILLYAVP